MYVRESVFHSRRVTACGASAQSRQSDCANRKRHRMCGAGSICIRATNRGSGNCNFWFSGKAFPNTSFVLLSPPALRAQSADAQRLSLQYDPSATNQLHINKFLMVFSLTKYKLKIEVFFSFSFILLFVGIVYVVWPSHIHTAHTYSTQHTAHRK